MDDFVSKLISYMGGRQRFEDEEGDEMEVADEGALDWDKIGRKALAKSRRVPVTGFMYLPSFVSRSSVLLIGSQAGPSLNRTEKTGSDKASETRESSRGGT